MKKYASIFVVILFITCISIAANFYLLQKISTPQVTTQLQMAGIYPLLSPRIFSEKQNDILINFVKLKQQLDTYTTSVKDPFGVYFEYLPSGVSIGENDTQEFIVVSLLKVPLVMAVYKNIEQGTNRPGDMLTIAKADQDNKFGTLWEKPVGTKISLKNAIRLTLADSDNTAKNVLGDTLTSDDIADVFDYLDLPKDSKGQNIVVSPKDYSSILRSLFLSSYLSKEHSNEILSFLTQSKFTDKLPAGIPTNIPVAHKIGVYDAGDDSPQVYTDCGIVYVPERPYILCMMSQATESKARQYMVGVSRMIYTYVSMANK